MSSSGGRTADGFSAAPSSITATASPYTYQNTSGAAEDIMVTGGTVTAVDFSRDGATWYSTGLVVVTVRLSPGDKIKITYTLAPTITKVPR